MYTTDRSIVPFYCSIKNSIEFGDLNSGHLCSAQTGQLNRLVSNIWCAVNLKFHQFEVYLTVIQWRIMCQEYKLSVLMISSAKFQLWIGALFAIWMWASLYSTFVTWGKQLLMDFNFTRKTCFIISRSRVWVPQLSLSSGPPPARWLEVASA